VYTVNSVVKSSKKNVDTLEDSIVEDRSKHYQIKFNEGNEDYGAFLLYTKDLGSMYVFNDDMNQTDCPESFDCWCSCMEKFLLDNNYIKVKQSTISDEWVRASYQLTCS
jgi:hypothetical protein